MQDIWRTVEQRGFLHGFQQRNTYEQRFPSSLSEKPQLQTLEN